MVQCLLLIPPGHLLRSSTNIGDINSHLHAFDENLVEEPLAQSLLVVMDLPIKTMWNAFTYRECLVQ